jgi:tetratricopeptide (TPR) repeat protein
LLFRTEGAAAARQEFRRLFLMDEAAWRLGGHLRLALIGLATGRYSEAEKECRDGAELAEKVGEPEWSSDFRRLLGHCFLEGGRRDDAIAEFRAAVERAGSNTGRLREALLGLGRAQARAGDLAAAEDLTRQFRTLAQSGAGPQGARALDFFLGLLELEKGRPREAAAALEKAIGRLPPGGTQSGYRPSMYYHLGLALERAGDPAGATEAYDEITGSDGDRFAIAELFPLAVLGRARAQEALGHQAAAVEGYRSFLALWVDADPGRPEVDEARARLKALSSPSGSGR